MISSEMIQTVNKLLQVTKPVWDIPLTHDKKGGKVNIRADSDGLNLSYWHN